MISTAKIPKAIRREIQTKCEALGYLSHKVAKTYGVSQEALRRWAIKDRWRVRSKKPQVDDITKQVIVEKAIVRKIPVEELAEEYVIHKTTIYGWIAAAKNAPAQHTYMGDDPNQCALGTLKKIVTPELTLSEWILIDAAVGAVRLCGWEPDGTYQQRKFRAAVKKLRQQIMDAEIAK